MVVVVDLAGEEHLDRNPGPGLGMMNSACVMQQTSLVALRNTRPPPEAALVCHHRLCSPRRSWGNVARTPPP